MAYSYFKAKAGQFREVGGVEDVDGPFQKLKVKPLINFAASEG